MTEFRTPKWVEPQRLAQHHLFPATFFAKVANPCLSGHVATTQPHGNDRQPAIPEEILNYSRKDSVQTGTISKANSYVYLINILDDDNAFSNAMKGVFIDSLYDSNLPEMYNYFF